MVEMVEMGSPGRHLAPPLRGAQDAQDAQDGRDRPGAARLAKALISTVQVEGQPVKTTYRGAVDGDTIQGTREWAGGPNPGKRDWAATRKPKRFAK